MATVSPRLLVTVRLTLPVTASCAGVVIRTSTQRKADLKQQRLDLLDVLQSHGVKVDEPSYLTLVTAAANEVRTKLPNDDLGDPAQVERLWRASAGSAHGKMWPSVELRVSIEADGRSISFPDANAMSAILVLANKITRYGVFRFIDYAGHEPQLAERLQATSQRWYALIPKVVGAPERLPDAPVCIPAGDDPVAPNDGK